MMRNYLYVLIGWVLLASACVPNKKIVYLQHEEELKESVTTDSVVRTYQLGSYEYRIQPEDVLSIRFESLSQEAYDIFANQEGNTVGGNQATLALSGYMVNLDGSIQFPEIGKVEVGGLTLHEVETKLQTLANKYVDEPVVKVRLLNFRVTVLGEVRSEGMISSIDNRMTIMEAIAKAGGLDELADRSKVKVIRQTGGSSKVMYVNLLEERLMDNPAFFTHQNDIVIVSPLRQRAFRKYFGQNLSLFVSSLSVLLLTINLISN